MFERATNRRIRFRLNALLDQEPVSPTIDKVQREFITYIQGLMLILDQSPTGRALLKTASVNHVSVGLDSLLDPSSSFFYPSQNHFDFGYQPDVLQKTEKGQGRYLVSFIGGLRRAWHYLHGNSADISLRPEDFLRQFRCEEADIESITHLIGWELRAAGHSFLWRYLLSGPNGDMAVVFEHTVEQDHQSQFDGRALKATFNQWFAERERTNACDHLGLEIMDMTLMQRKYQANMGRLSLKCEHMQHLGLLPSGQNYLAGCHFTSGWYDGLDDVFNRQHLKNIEMDISRMADKKENIHRS